MHAQTDSTARYDDVVVGGGFYGCMLAAHLSRSRGRRVLLLEAAGELLGRASFANQARVHNGYHYPRSFLTAYRSRVNCERFVREFEACVVDDFEKHYAIGRNFSNVSAAQFELFCRRIGAVLEPASPAVASLFEPRLVERVYRAREVAFDASKLREAMIDRLQDGRVEVLLGAEAHRVQQAQDGLQVDVRVAAEPSVVSTKQVFNCTYSGLNRLLSRSGLRPIPLKHEWTELALVEVPERLANLGITIMCGPFFSLMPFPPRGMHTLSHVRYTPHREWLDGNSGELLDPHALAQSLPRRSHFRPMLQDARRYVPAIGECRHVDSLWEVKTVLPRSEVDDSRPILFKKDYGLPGLFCILGSKIDNVFDMIGFAEATFVESKRGA